MQSNESKMQKRLYHKFKTAGFSDRDYTAIMNDFMSQYGGNFVDDLESMDRDTFNDFLASRLIPYAQESLNIAALKYPNQAEALGSLGAKLTKVNDPWTRERFLNTMLRKSKKDTLDDGTIKEEPPHIGAIGSLDRNLLRAEGLDDDEIDYYADKFRQEWLDENTRKVIDEMKDSAQVKRDILAADVPDHMIPEEDYPILSKLNPVIGTVAKIFGQETVQRMKEDFSKGIDPTTDPVLLKTMGKDALIGIGSMVIPGKIGGKAATYAGAKIAPKAANWLRGISKSARVAPMVAKGVPLAADAAVEGVTDAGLELGRQAMSDYYDMDVGNAATTGMISATIPAGVKGAIAMGSQVPGLSKIAQPIAKHVRGVDLEPKEIESAMADQLVMDAKEQSAAVKGLRGKEKALANEYKRDKVGQLAEFANQHPNRAGVAVNLTVDETDNLLKKGGRGLDKVTKPPTREEFKKMIWNKTHKEGVDSDYAAEAIERFKKQWPEHYKAYNNISDPKWAYKAGNLADKGTYFYARKETAEGRNEGRLAPSPELAELMRTDPALIRQWKAKFAPSGKGPEADLYKEWVSKYGTKN